MSDWAPSHDAPRDRPVWLFLPSSSYKTDERGRPFDVKHEHVVAQWSDQDRAWKVRGSERHVYPSMWWDGDVDGPGPDPAGLELI